MNATQNAVENLDLNKLNDQDKAEIRQFLENQQQRSNIQSRKYILPGHRLTRRSNRNSKNERKKGRKEEGKRGHLLRAGC